MENLLKELSKLKSPDKQPHIVYFVTKSILATDAVSVYFAGISIDNYNLNNPNGIHSFCSILIDKDIARDLCGVGENEEPIHGEGKKRQINSSIISADRFKDIKSTLIFKAIIEIIYSNCYDKQDVKVVNFIWTKLISKYKRVDTLLTKYPPSPYFDNELTLIQQGGKKFQLLYASCIKSKKFKLSDKQIRSLHYVNDGSSDVMISDLYNFIPYDELNDILKPIVCELLFKFIMKDIKFKLTEFLEEIK